MGNQLDESQHEKFNKEEWESTVQEYLKILNIPFDSFVSRLIAKTLESNSNQGEANIFSIKIQILENIEKILENMTSFGNTMGMNEFGESINISAGYSEKETNKPTNGKILDGIFARAGL